ncbi:MAG: sugar phosphate isomerase/epimerase family protein, partial [Blastopirellula sp. JB062]
SPAPDLSPQLKNDLKSKAGDLGIQLIGIYGKLENPESAKAMFEFASEMGLEFIVSEPPISMFDTIEGLTQQYEVDFALHNHPQPSNYWNPDVGLKALQDRSQRMGFCCDTGHWCRSDLDPVAMLKKVGARAKTFHLKDLDEFGNRDAKDVVWGQGKGQIAELLAETQRLDLKLPYFSIEWERNPSEPLQTHAASVAYAEQIAAKHAAS